MRMGSNRLRPPAAQLPAYRRQLQPPAHFRLHEGSRPIESIRKSVWLATMLNTVFADRSIMDSKEQAGAKHGIRRQEDTHSKCLGP